MAWQKRARSWLFTFACYIYPPFLLASHHWLVALFLYIWLCWTQEKDQSVIGPSIVNLCVGLRSHVSVYDATVMQVASNGLARLKRVRSWLFTFACYIYPSFLLASHHWRCSLFEGPEKATRGGGVNGSQSKFLTGIWPMSQNQPDVPLY
jgi:hypothetical protein